MTFRSKSILPDGFRSKPIINKVLDYVFGDFKGPIGRKTYSLLCNEIVSSFFYTFVSKTKPINDNILGHVICMAFVSLYTMFAILIDNLTSL